MKTTEEVIKNGNSTVNQRIKEEFVGKHVYCNVGSLIGDIYNEDNPVYVDNIENYYALDVENVINNIMLHFDIMREDYIEFANDLDTFNRGVKNASDFEVFLNSLDTDELKEFCEKFHCICDEEPQEVYEWWAVSKCLYERLRDLEHPVVDAGSCYVWGRTRTGQSIVLDSVITRICAEMEILDGQKYSWANKEAA